MIVALLTYHPSVGTFRGARGAWRVHVSHRVCDGIVSPAPDAGKISVTKVYAGGNEKMPIRALRMPVARQLPRGTWVNPTKLLREQLGVRRRHLQFLETISQPYGEPA